MTETSTAPAPQSDGDDPTSDSVGRTLIGRITRLEMAVGATIAAILLVLVIIEPGILEAPFENERTILFTVGGTVLASIAFAAMLWLRVPAIVRVVVLVVPFAIVSWWLISPYFIDDVVDEEFSTSISEQLADEPVAPPPPPTDAPAVTDPPPATTAEPVTDAPAVTVAPPATPAPPATEPATTPAPPSGPVLLGAGRFVGLAGHSGTGDAGIFQNPDGSLVLRFENFDIENGPDLEVYLVPGADQTSLADGSIHLGALKGNVGDQNYELPAGPLPGTSTVLVWCEAFSVEFVGATVTI